MISTLTLLAALLAPGSTTPGTGAPATPPGDRWEVTSQMSMEGMPMRLPASKVKVCTHKEWTEPPVAADERRKCVNSDFKVEGDTATWRVSCAGPPAMTGDGEIRREGPDSWKGAIRFSSPDGAMTLKLTGTKLGECEEPK
jgi:hypothetical protein